MNGDRDTGKKGADFRSTECQVAFEKILPRRSGRSRGGDTFFLVPRNRGRHEAAGGTFQLDFSQGGQRELKGGPCRVVDAQCFGEWDELGAAEKRRDD